MSLVQPFDNVRTDPLTNCHNLLAFADWLISYCNTPARGPVTLLSLDLDDFVRINADHSRGDTILRWVGLTLADEMKAPVFRTGGDEFVVVLQDGEWSSQYSVAEQLDRRLNREASLVGMHTPVATIAIVHFTERALLTPADVLSQLRASIVSARTRGRSLDVLAVHGAPQVYDLRPVVNDLLDRLIDLSNLLSESREMAHTDPVTGLPNLRAALLQLDAALSRAAALGQPACVLFIDGDNLRRYNTLGYAAGDTLLQQLSLTLRTYLRPADFLARWRVGDEFIVILPNTALADGQLLGEGLRHAIQEASEAWHFPITISIGVAAYPQHGTSADEILRQGEKAKDRAKTEGKNCVIAAT